MVHIPVLQKQVLDYLDPKTNENFIDATFGEGGYAKAILERTKPKGKILGIEIDPGLYKNKNIEIENNQDFSGRIILVNDSYINLKQIVEREKFYGADGIIFDLGMSSWHLEKSKRGFSFLKNEPLDMRYKDSAGEELTAKEILNEWDARDLESIFKEYGEERFAKRIASAIGEFRKKRGIETTFQLVEVIKKATPAWYHHKRIHPATRVFQALRIVVNQELKNIKRALPQSIEVIKTGGRIIIISFHSLEDRLIKNFLKVASKNNLLRVLTKKPITADKEEIRSNPRARSAKLRAAIKL
ncbi:MAG TPA: 16S rRNA (cytosine(1402)-N(4))-methyltransferase RsmH [Candidatus Parcubacteria bacterium]|nr:16S rRNA (cytosine(1402)-N(4))-methyltransferase RsmH [Candidatus Parcubacteria bacterium]